MTDWDRALCAQVDPEIFYPPPNNKAGARARSVCLSCPIVAECLAWAVEHNEPYGIWGGKSETARRHMRRQLKKVGAA